MAVRDRHTKTHFFDVTAQRIGIDQRERFPLYMRGSDIRGLRRLLHMIKFFGADS